MSNQSLLTLRSLINRHPPTHSLLCLYKEAHVNISKHFWWAINFFPLGNYLIDDNNEAMHILEINSIKMSSFGLLQEF